MCVNEQQISTLFPRLYKRLETERAEAFVKYLYLFSSLYPDNSEVNLTVIYQTRSFLVYDGTPHHDPKCLSVTSQQTKTKR